MPLNLRASTFEQLGCRRIDVANYARIIQSQEGNRRRFKNREVLVPRVFEPHLRFPEFFVFDVEPLLGQPQFVEQAAALTGVPEGGTVGPRHGAHPE